MFPLLRLVGGVLIGALGVRLVKNYANADTARNAAGKIRHLTHDGLERTGAGLRDVAVSGLTTVEKTSASLRARLTPAPEAAADEPPAPVKPARRGGRKPRAAAE